MKSKHFFRIFVIIPFITAALLITASCGSSDAEDTASHEPVAENHLALGTVSRITIYDQPADRAREIIQAAFARVDEIEEAMSLYKPGSEVDRVNDQAGKQAVEISREIFSVLAMAKEVAVSSDGAFDPTVGALVTAWGIGTDNPSIPGTEQLDELINLVDYSQLELTDHNGSRYEAKLLKEGMQIDLGGIAKGYAADEVKRIITEMGSSSALVNLGGNIMLVGTKPDGTDWRIGVQDPGSGRGDYVMIVSLEEGTVVTSGIYERFFTREGEHFHHILDTKTGFPAENELESITIIAENSAFADALSTAAFVLGLEQGLQYMEDIPEAEAVFLTKDKKIYYTSGIGSPGLTYRIVSQDYEVITGGP